MSVKVECPHCSKVYKLDPERFAKPQLRFKCKACGGRIDVDLAVLDAQQNSRPVQTVSAPNPLVDPKPSWSMRSTRELVRFDDFTVDRRARVSTSMHDVPAPREPRTSVGEALPNEQHLGERVGKVQFRLSAIDKSLEMRDLVLHGTSRMSLGRGAENDITVDYKGISRQHAYLWPRPDGLLVVDLESRNGVYVNYKRVERGEVQHGDKLSFADLTFQVSREMVE